MDYDKDDLFLAFDGVISDDLSIASMGLLRIQLEEPLPLVPGKPKKRQAPRVSASTVHPGLSGVGTRQELPDVVRPMTKARRAGPPGASASSIAKAPERKKVPRVRVRK